MKKYNVMPTKWDDEILSRKSCEVEIPSVFDNEIYNELKSLEYDYIVIKSPSKLHKSFLEFTSRHFFQVETQFKLDLNLIDYNNPGEISKKLLNGIEYRRIISDSELESIVQLIIQNDPFNSDRISIDPQFSIKIANIRYVNWLRNLYRNMGEIYEVTLDNTPLGAFVISPISKNEVSLVLTFLYDIKSFGGIGILLILMSRKVALVSGYKSMTTKISSNNSSSLKIHLDIGFKISEVNNVYVFHKSI